MLGAKASWNVLVSVLATGAGRRAGKFRAVAGVCRASSLAAALF